MSPDGAETQQTLDEGDRVRRPLRGAARVPGNDQRVGVGVSDLLGPEDGRERHDVEGERFAVGQFDAAIGRDLPLAVEQEASFALTEQCGHRRVSGVPRHEAERAGKALHEGERFLERGRIDRHPGALIGDDRPGQARVQRHEPSPGGGRVGGIGRNRAVLPAGLFHRLEGINEAVPALDRLEVVAGRVQQAGLPRQVDVVVHDEGMGVERHRINRPLHGGFGPGRGGELVLGDPAGGDARVLDRLQQPGFGQQREPGQVRDGHVRRPATRRRESQLGVVGITPGQQRRLDRQVTRFLEGVHHQGHVGAVAAAEQVPVDDVGRGGLAPCGTRQYRRGAGRDQPGEGQAAARSQKLAARNRSAHTICAPHLTAV